MFSTVKAGEMGGCSLAAFCCGASSGDTIAGFNWGGGGGGVTTGITTLAVMMIECYFLPHLTAYKILSVPKNFCTKILKTVSQCFKCSYI